MPLRVKGGANAAQLWRVPEARHPRRTVFHAQGPDVGEGGANNRAAVLTSPPGVAGRRAGRCRRQGFAGFPPAFRERVVTFLGRPHWERGLLPGAERDVAEAVN